MSPFAPSLVALLALFACVVHSYTDDALSDKIDSLPGIGEVPFNQFAGYLNVNATLGRYMFYWYVESQNNPSSDPVALWTNGGPGCSGLIGFLTENGPFRPLANGSLQLNPYSWNQNINYLFVEQPIGVGFSYSETGGDDYQVGDSRAAQDNYQAILQFLVRFPAVAKNDFYLTSESYGGHYMPTLAKTILQAQANSRSPVNFKGFAVGNPFTDTLDNAFGNAETLWGHQLVPLSLWTQYEKVCKGIVGVRPLECEQAIAKMDVATGKINRYALDWPLCTADTALEEGFLAKGEAFYLQEYDKAVRGVQTEEELQRRLRDYGVYKDKRRREVSQRAYGAARDNSNINGNTEEEWMAPEAYYNNYYMYDPCAEDYASTYLNRADVQSAIHAKKPPFNNGMWSECSNIPYSVTDHAIPMQPVYQYLLKYGDSQQKYLVFSGDNDDVCSTMSTQDWVYELGYEIHTPWNEYMTSAGLPSTQIQVGGFIVKFSTPTGSPQFSFMTVHGAGHEVPAYKPAVAQELIQGFISGKWFVSYRDKQQDTLTTKNNNNGNKGNRAAARPLAVK
eukprot:gb/GEZN01004417.1/.p1 GENE.gb/GEZN01004417.1/~~gb/GEZN01004417.1/.p1  ORF type:complete len:563 (-),score=76.99 gb/GEZN01004417.1/:244-1932(-)